MRDFEDFAAICGYAAFTKHIDVDVVLSNMTTLMSTNAGTSENTAQRLKEMLR